MALPSLSCLHSKVHGRDVEALLGVQAEIERAGGKALSITPIGSLVDLVLALTL